jgi:hypothetical protein
MKIICEDCKWFFAKHNSEAGIGPDGKDDCYFRGCKSCFKMDKNEFNNNLERQRFLRNQKLNKINGNIKQR